MIELTTRIYIYFIFHFGKLLKACSVPLRKKVHISVKGSCKMPSNKLPCVSFHMNNFTLNFRLLAAKHHAAEEKSGRETRHAHSRGAAGAAGQARWQTVLTTGSSPDGDAAKSGQARKLRTGWHIPVVLLYGAMGCNLRLYLPWSLGWVKVTICSSSSLKIMGWGGRGR